METQEFIEMIEKRGYSYRLVDGKIVFDNEGCVFLDFLIELPEGIVFKNKGYVSINPLKKLHKNVVFDNEGNVYLDSLKKLPENVVFKNKGNVLLPSLIELPEGIVFKNKGYVSINPLKKLPENVVFDNEGHVFLPSLENDIQTYRGKQIRLKMIDRFTMLIQSEREIGGMTVYKCRYFGGGSLSDLPSCFVAEEGGFSAHGRNLKEVIEDLRFKLEKEIEKERECVKSVSRVKETQVVTMQDYRNITGACREGIRAFLKSQDVPEDTEEMPLSWVRENAQDQYGYDRFFELVGV